MSKRSASQSCGALLIALLLSHAPQIFAEPADIGALAATCNNCHGLDGVSAGGSMASIAGQTEGYLVAVMDEWRKGERFSTVMGRLLAGYTEEQIKALAAYFAAQPWTPAEQGIDRQQATAQGKIPAGRCARCHGLTGGKPKTEDTPRIDGQWLGHLELGMLKYRDESLEFPHAKMQESVRKVKEADVPLVSRYFASQSSQ